MGKFESAVTVGPALTTLRHAERQRLESDPVTHPRVRHFTGKDVVLNFGADTESDGDASEAPRVAEGVKLTGRATETKTEVATEEEVGNDLATDLHEDRHLTRKAIGHREISPPRPAACIPHGHRIAGAQGHLETDPRRWGGGGGGWRSFLRDRVPHEAEGACQREQRKRFVR